MIAVSESTTIDRPVADVFAFLDLPANQPAVTPSLVRSEALERLPNGGRRVAYTYRILGARFTGELEALEYEPERRIRWAMTGDIEGTITWELEPVDGGDRTRFTYAAEYAAPLGIAVLDSLLAPLVRWYNRRELRRTVRNLRAHLEATGWRR